MEIPRKLRIMFVVQSLVKGGAERMVLEISNELLKRNLAKVIIVGFHNANEYPELSKNIKFVHCPIVYKLSVFRKNNIDTSSLTKTIQDFKPDIIHTNCYMQEGPPREILLNNVTYFSHLHDNMPAFRKMKFFDWLSKKRIAEYYEKRRLIALYKQSDNQFIAISNDTLNYFKKNLPKSLSQKVLLLPNAIDYSQFFFDKARSISSKHEINLVNVGHFAPKKNQIFLIEVLNILQKNNINAKLTLIGNSTKVKDHFFKTASEYGLADKLIMPGLVNNVEEHLKQADIYVHSALYEAFGLVLLEAMASGLPVVCLDAGGNRDIVENGKNGFIIADKNPELFAEKIIDLITNNQLYSEMSSYAITYAKQYDITSYVGKLMTLYSTSVEIK